MKEAEQVTVSMSEKTFVPPPRRVDDILSILDQPGLFDPEIIARHKAGADALPPDTGNSAELAQFYLNRGISARELGRSQRALEDLRKALHYAETEAVKEKPQLAAAIRSHLGTVEAAFGNFNRAIALQKQVIEIRPQTRSYGSLTSYYLVTGDLRAAEEVKDEGVEFCDKKLSDPMISAREELWATIHKTDMQAAIMQAKGKHAEAELHYRYIVKLVSQAEKKAFPRAYLMRRLNLAMNLLWQGRFVEAELEARETLKESIGLGGKESATTGRSLFMLGRIYGRQGRLNDAEDMTRAAIRALEAAGLSRDSSRMGSAMMLLGDLSYARLDFTEAMKHFDTVKQGMVSNQYFYENRYARWPSVIISLIKTGRTQEAMESISKWYGKYNEYFGEKHYHTAQMQGLRGMANAMLENETQALQDFSGSVPLLLKKAGDESGYFKNLRLKLILESYLELLTKIHKDKREKDVGIDPSAEMFKVCQGITDSIVQNALGASGARAAADDPDLADLVRKEQDALTQIDSFQDILSDAIAAPRDQQNPDALSNLRTAIASLNSARAVLLDETKRRFPKYADFTAPQPATFSAIQKHLRPGEALIALFPATDQTYVWAIPYKGEVHFAIEPIGKENLQRIVVHLRQALDSDPGSFGDIPAFDLSRAHSLYRQLLQPVEKGWKDANDVIVVAHGALAQLPFSVLPTAPVMPGPEQYELFARYRWCRG
ncbi:MAG: tetratricopeptide repeat protein [Candidatus Omnitrophota bacterium]